MSVQDYPVSFSLEVNVEKAYEDLRRLETVAYRTLSLLRRATGDENVDKAIAKVLKLIAALNAARLALASYKMALATTPGIGWIFAAIGTVEALSLIGGLLEDAGWDLHRHQMSW